MAKYETLSMDAHSSLSLQFLYRSIYGRLVCKLLVRPCFSKLIGAYLNSRFSVSLIHRFIEKNRINMSEYESGPFPSFNAFFKRRIKPGARPFSREPNAFCAPCDAKLSAYRADEASSFFIKGSRYTMESILRDPALAGRYKDGVCLIFRLMPEDYHRYCYIDEGTVLYEKKIHGVLHTVRPIALYSRPIFAENSREYALIHYAHLGDTVQMEVGALMVGKISNRACSGPVSRGEERGTFEFGGSTIVLLLQKDAAYIDETIFENTSRGLESIVKMGQRIGTCQYGPSACMRQGAIRQ